MKGGDAEVFGEAVHDGKLEQVARMLAGSPEPARSAARVVALAAGARRKRRPFEEVADLPRDAEA